MLVAAVGTFIEGFDQLVAAVDRSCALLELEGFAQIGHSRAVPHAMRWQRFLPHDELLKEFRSARLVVCHAGMGIVGEAMRANVPIILFPRTDPPCRGHPINDQSGFAERIAAQHGLAVCTDGAALPAMVARILAGPSQRHYEFATDLPAILGEWLTGAGAPATRGRRAFPPARKA